MSGKIHLCKFGYLNDKPFLYAAKITVRQLDPKFCTLYMHISERNVQDNLKGFPAYAIPTIKAMSVLKSHGFVVCEVDYNTTMNKFNFESIRLLNPPLTWWSVYLYANRVTK